MNRDLVVGLIAAALAHGALLFGFHLGSEAVALPLGPATEAVEVTLVAPPPAVQEAVAPPQEATPDPVPEPAPPDPEPMPPPPELAPTPIPDTPPPPRLAPQPRPELKRPAPHPPSAHPVTGAPDSHTPPGPSSGAPATGAAHGGNSPARYRSNPQPPYPAAARQQSQQGVVYLNVEVNAEGRPASISLSRSSGFPLLDEAAIAGVRHWTFEPGRVGGLAIASRVTVPVRFRLH